MCKVWTYLLLSNRYSGPLPKALEMSFRERFGRDMMILFGDPMPSVNHWFTANERAIARTHSAGINVVNMARIFFE